MLAAVIAGAAECTSDAQGASAAHDGAADGGAQSRFRCTADEVVHSEHRSSVYSVIC